MHTDLQLCLSRGQSPEPGSFDSLKKGPRERGRRGQRGPTGSRTTPPSSLLYLELAQLPVLAEIQTMHLLTKKTDERNDKRGCKGTAGKEEEEESLWISHRDPGYIESPSASPPGKNKTALVKLSRAQGRRMVLFGSAGDHLPSLSLLSSLVVNTCVALAIYQRWPRGECWGSDQSVQPDIQSDAPNVLQCPEPPSITRRRRWPANSHTHEVYLKKAL